MIFEGSEKKAEIILKNDDKANAIGLLDFSFEFWKELVAKSNATILSHIKNDKMAAYLLSESSLFVWEDRILLITCGQTTLINAIDFFINKIGKENVAQLIFQRKNEYYSHLQPSTFFDDIKLLEERFSGSAFRMGTMDDHHNFIYHIEADYTPAVDDHTYELLMYDISSESSALLTKENLKAQEIRDYLQLDKILPGFEIDDFVFDPFGYSMNAISGDNYFTIHITPQEEGSYISFETDINLKEHANTLLNILGPGSFDFIEFIPSANDERPLENVVEFKEHYIQKTSAFEKLSCGYDLHFSHHYINRTTKLTGHKLL